MLLPWIDNMLNEFEKQIIYKWYDVVLPVAQEQIYNMFNIDSNTIRNVFNYKLSRYVCYLIVLNC